jgi:hypothetical protein
MKRIFKITSTSGSRFVYPINDDSLLYKWKKLKDSINYELELTSRLIFTNNAKEGIDDFTYFYGFEKNVLTRCETLTVEIFKVCNGLNVLEFKGIMPLNGGEWNLDRCEVSFEVKNSTSIYDCISDNKKETSIPISQYMPQVNGNPDVSCGFTLPDYDTDAANRYFGTPPVAGLPFGFYDTTVSGEYEPIYIYGDTVCITSDGSTWTAVGNGVWSKTSPYADHVTGNLFNIYDESPTVGQWTFITNVKLNTANYFYNERENPVAENTFDVPYQSFAMLCTAIVHELLVKCGRDTDLPMLRSDFFDWNATGDVTGYIPSVITKLPLDLSADHYPTGSITSIFKYVFLPITPGINYVTGQPNHLTHLQFMPKSNANNNSANEWEQYYFTPDGIVFNFSDNKFTFEDLEKLWAYAFGAYWFIDADGCMRVEHLSYFNNIGLVYNSTISPNERYNQSNNKYIYEKDLLPQLERFKFSQNKDFINGAVETGIVNKNNEIFYEGVCVNLNESSNEVDYAVSKVVTDVRCLDSANNGDSDLYDKNGLFLFTVSFSAKTNEEPEQFGKPHYLALAESTIENEQLYLNASPTLYENAHVQWGNLIRRYLRDNSVLITGKNGADIITFTAKTRKSKVQQNVIIRQCCDDVSFNPLQASIITQLGTGIVDEAEYNTKTEIIKIKVLHD